MGSPPVTPSMRPTPIQTYIRAQERTCSGLNVHLLPKCGRYSRARSPTLSHTTNTGKYIAYMHCSTSWTDPWRLWVSSEMPPSSRGPYNTKHYEERGDGPGNNNNNSTHTVPHPPARSGPAPAQRSASRSSTSSSCWPTARGAVARRANERLVVL